MKKSIIKVFSVILVVVLTLTSAPLSGLVGLELPEWLDFSIISSAAETSGTCGENVTWTFDESAGTLTISGTGAMFDYDSNNRPWESYRYSIKKVIIGNGVTTIGSYAFDWCINLTSVTLGDSITAIGFHAFSTCDISSIKIPDSVITIGSYAFYGCNNLTNVIIGSGVREIYNCSFAYCNKLTNIIIPDNVTLLDSMVFYECVGLTSVTIGNSVTKIDYHTFYGCTSLTDVTIGNSVTIIGEDAFEHCESLTNITIPESVTTIDENAFSYCESLISVTIPSSVTSIGYGAFKSCTSLKDITIYDSVTTIGAYAFNNCTSLTDVYYSGTEESWNKIVNNFNGGNDPLLNATIHFNSTGENIDADFDFESSDYTQGHVISNYINKNNEYEAKYFSGYGVAMDGTSSNVDYCIPGLIKKDNMVPQGITYYPEKDWILISAYNKDKERASVIYALDKTTGKYVAQFDIYNNNGTMHTGHLGGIAISNNNLYLSNGKQLSYISLSKFNVDIGTVATITINDSKSLSSRLGEANVSYVTITDGVMYVGNFYNTTKNFKMRASKDYASVIVGYTLSGTTSDDEWNNLTVSSPSYTYNIADNSGIKEIQSATVKDGNLLLSCSYGRKNDSTLYIVNVGNTPNTSYYVDEIDYSCSALPMMEGITFIDGEVYAVFESAAYYYRDKSLFNKAKNPTDVIWRFDYESILSKISNEFYVGDFENVPIAYDDKGIINLNFKQSWFENNSAQYNHNLSTLCSQFVTLGYDVENLENDLKLIGFKNVFWETEANKDQVDNFIASRDITVNEETYTLLFVGCIGTNSVQWYSNFEPGTGETHASFNNAKNYVYGNIQNYIDTYNIDTSKTKILLCGHSRGAATANLVGAQLIDEEKFATKENIYTYTFATPNPTSSSKTSNSKYDRIFNFVNPEDFVTKVLPAQWGYSRYGTTYTLPSKTNTYAYSTLKSNMQEEYEIILNGQKYHPYPDGEKQTYDVVNTLTNHVNSVNQLYTKEFNWLEDKASIQEFFTQTLCKFMANKPGSTEKNEAQNALLNTLADEGRCDTPIFMLAQYFVVYQGIGGATSGWIMDDYFQEAHQAETYCAYMMSMTGSQVRAYRSGYKNTVNCPVDIEVYDKSTGELVGKIVNNVIDEDVASKDSAIVMSVDGDSKSFWLPSDGEYDIKLIGNDNGTMDYTVAEIDGDSVEKARVNFIDVEIIDNKSISGDFTGEEFTLEEYSLTTEDGMTINNDDLITSGNADEFKFDVTISTEGVGFATGDGTFTKGDYVTVSASTDELNEFLGWYVNGKRVSTDAEYGFVAQNDVELTAKFTNNTQEPEYNYTFEIKQPSRTEIRNKDGIILHAKVDDTAPNGSYVRWESSNDNFDKSADGSNLKIIANNKGYTTFTAILCDADGKELARDSVEMYSKSGFFDKIGGFFRSLFGTTKIYEN